MNWLPELVARGEAGWDDYEDVLFNHFCTDFVSNCPKIGKHRLGIEAKPAVHGRHKTFWHLISEGGADPLRTICPNRCERIRWPRPLIMEAIGRGLPAWRNQRHGEGRLLIATEDYSYLVVLGDRRGYYYLFTAYCVEWEARRAKLKAEHEAYQSQKNQPQNG